MSEPRILPTQKPRVESGPVQFGNDWPGVFIRGDDAFAAIMAVCSVIEFTNRGTLPSRRDLRRLRGIGTLLQGCVIGEVPLIPEVVEPPSPEVPMTPPTPDAEKCPAKFAETAAKLSAWSAREKRNGDLDHALIWAAVADLQYAAYNFPELTQTTSAQARRIEDLEEIVRDDPSKWSFDALLFMARRLLDANYPDGLFGEGARFGDCSGSRFVTALRRTIEEVERAMTPSRGAAAEETRDDGSNGNG